MALDSVSPRPSPPMGPARYPKRRAYLLIEHQHRNTAYVMLGQKNIYLPPHGSYQWASISSNAVQYVLPGGSCRTNEDPRDAALRHVEECTGLKIPSASVAPLVEHASDAFFHVMLTGQLDLSIVNKSLEDGRVASLQLHHVRWFALTEGICALGNKQEYQSLPWVSPQLLRAINAGFAEEYISGRANEPFDKFAAAIAYQLVRRGGFLGTTSPAPQAGSQPSQGAHEWVRPEAPSHD